MQGTAPKPHEDTKGDVTRRHIKNVIARLASEKPLSRINLAEICSAAGLTTGAVYFHFGGKDQAIEEMVVDEMRGLYPRMMGESGDTFEVFVRRIASIVAAYLQDNGRLPKAVYTMIATKSTVGRAWLDVRQPVVDKLARLIAVDRENNRLSAEPAPFLAHFILNSIEDLSMDLFQWSNTEFASFANNAEDWIDRQCALWNWAILAPVVPGQVKPGKRANTRPGRPASRKG